MRWLRLAWRCPVADLTPADIADAWREGRASADHYLGTLPQPEVQPCPYPEGTALAQWWNRGYSSMARQLRALAAERERDEARSEVARLTAERDRLLEEVAVLAEECDSYRPGYRGSPR